MVDLLFCVRIRANLNTNLDFSPGVVVVKLGGGMDAWVGFCGSGHVRVVPCRRVVRAFPGPVGLSWSVGQVVES